LPFAAALAKRKYDLFSFGLLALLALLFFWPVTFNRGWIPRGGGDLVSLLWPNYSYAAQALHAGRLPFWNASLFSGMPFAADNQTSLFYLPNLLAFFLAPSLPYIMVEWLVVFHFWLAGVSMYGLMRVLLSAPGSPDNALSPQPALHPSSLILPPLFSAIAFMFSDLFVTHIGNLNLNAVSAWLPAVFAALHLALTRRSMGWAAGAGILLGLSTLAGHAQMTYIVTIGLGPYALWRIAWCIVREQKYAIRNPQHAREALLAAWRASLPLLLTLLLFAVAVGVSSALTVIPSLELTRYTARLRLTYAEASSYSIPWAGLAGLFSPLIFGRGPGNFWGPWDRVELGYLGVLPLFFAGLAPFKERRGVTVFLALLAVFGLLVALGANAPLHRLLYLATPGVAQMRVPSRYILLTDFALAALAGFGLHHFASVSRKRLWRWGAALWLMALATILLGYRAAISVTGAQHAAALIMGLLTTLLLLSSGMALTTLGSRRLTLGLAVALLAADLLGHGAWVEVDDTDPTLGFQHQKVTAFLQAQPGPTRIDNASGAWSPSAAARFGLEDVSGVNHALLLAGYQAYYWSVGARGTPLYNFLNAQFVIADKNRPPADYTFVPVFNEDPALDIYLNTNAEPRVRLVYAATVVPTSEAAFAAIHAPDFDPSQSVVAEFLSAPARPAGVPTGESNLYYLSYAPESFSIVAVTPAPAYLVFSEVWYPGWRAWVDGNEVPIFRANYAFRGVYLDSAGEHVVTLRFEPLSWMVGLSVTLLTLAGLSIGAGAAIYRWGRGRKA